MWLRLMAAPTCCLGLPAFGVAVEGIAVVVCIVAIWIICLRRQHAAVFWRRVSLSAVQLAAS